MNTWYNRLYGMSGYLVTTIIVFMTLQGISGLLMDAQTVDMTFTVRGFESAKKDFQTESYNFRFDLKADFTDVFNWNVKQIFLYITAEYTDEIGMKHKVVVWDKIIRWNQVTKLNLVNQGTKYPLTHMNYFENYYKRVSDVRTTVVGKEIVFQVHWDVMPFNGAYRIKDGASYTFTIPEED